VKPAAVETLTAEMRAALEQWSAAFGVPWTAVPGLVLAATHYAYTVRYAELVAAGRSEAQAAFDAGWEVGVKGGSVERALRRWKWRNGDRTSAP
jgi:hypothetical protein